MSNAALVERVKTGFQKIKNELPYIVELRHRFYVLPRGKAGIDGCQTWTEFCEHRLHRSDRQVRRVLAEAIEALVAPGLREPEAEPPARNPNLNPMLNTIVQGDAFHIPMAPETFQLVITSPPYFGLRSYEGNPPDGFGRENRLRIRRAHCRCST